MIGAHIVDFARVAAIHNTSRLQTTENSLKIIVTHMKRDMIGLNIFSVSVIEHESIIDMHRCKMTMCPVVAQAHDFSEPSRRNFMVMRGDDDMIDSYSHGELL